MIGSLEQDLQSAKSSSGTSAVVNESASKELKAQVSQANEQVLKERALNKVLNVSNTSCLRKEL